MIRNSSGTIYGEGEFPGQGVEELVRNAYALRSDLVNRALHSRKDIGKECDYPEVIGIRDYWEMYGRSSIGSRVVSILPEECWQVCPSVEEDGDMEERTEFEEAWDALGRWLHADNADNWYVGKEGNPIWECLQRVDKLSGIGHFGVVLLGLDDRRPLEEPVEGFSDEPMLRDMGVTYINNEKLTGKKLLYLSPFSEISVQDIEFDNVPYSPRYRRPKFYYLDLGAEQDYSSYVTTGATPTSIKVHWSRIFHVADNSDSSEVIGVPRMKPVWNNLLDLMKVYGGDAEGFWRGCVLRLFLESHPSLGGDVTLDESTLKERMWDMENGLQRWAALLGLSVKSIAPRVVDPTPHINTQIEAICIKLGIPKRVFMGSERGELASGQDDSTWNDRIRGRRNNYLIPRMIVPFINRLILMGVLPKPKTGFKLFWRDPENLKPGEVASLAVQRVQAMLQYVNGGVNTLIGPFDFLTKELGMDKEEARKVLDNAEPPPPPEEMAPEEGVAPAEGEEGTVPEEEGVAPAEGEMEEDMEEDISEEDVSEEDMEEDEDVIELEIEEEEEDEDSSEEDTDEEDEEEEDAEGEEEDVEEGMEDEEDDEDDEVPPRKKKPTRNVEMVERLQEIVDPNSPWASAAAEASKWAKPEDLTGNAVVHALSTGDDPENWYQSARSVISQLKQRRRENIVVKPQEIIIKNQMDTLPINLQVTVQQEKPHVEVVNQVETPSVEVINQIQPTPVNIEAPHVEVHPPQVTVKAPHVEVHPPQVTVEAPKQEVQVTRQPEEKKPTRAKIKHSDGSVSEVELQ